MAESSPESILPADLQTSISSFIESSLDSRLKFLKKRLKSKLSSEILLHKSELASLNSKLSSALSSVSSLQDDFTAFEISRQQESRRYSRQKSLATDAEEKVERFAREAEYIQSSLIHINSELAMKAHVTDVNRLMDMMEKLCPKIVAEQMEEKVNEKTDNEVTKQLRREVDILTSRMNQDVIPRADLEKILRKMQEHTESTLTHFISSQQFTRYNQDLENQIATVQTQMKDLAASLKQETHDLITGLKETREELSGKANTLLVIDLRNKVDTCAPMKLLDRTNEAVERCSVLVEDVRSDVERTVAGHEEVLRRYDEILLDKANKTDVAQLQFRSVGLKDVEELKSAISVLQSDLKSLRSQHSKNTQVQDDFSKRLQDLKSVLTQQRPDKRDSLSILSASKSLIERLDLKAEKTDLASIHDTKATKLEVQSIARSLGVLYRLEKLVIMLLSHSVKCLSEVTAEVSPGNFAAADWLVKHAEMVASWASLYEPIENEIEFPPDIQNLLAAARSNKALFPQKGAVSPLGQTPRGKMMLSASHAFGSGQITRKLLSRRYESLTRRGAPHLPSLEGGLESP